LVLAGGILGLLVGIPAGGFAATRHRQLGDITVTATSMLGLSIPGFVTATSLLLFFGLFLKWVPTAGFVSFTASPWVHAQFLVLPATTLGIHMGAVVARFSRSAMLEVLGQDYVRTARAKGLGSKRIQYRHVLRNALIPIITIVGLESGVLLGGTIIVEYVFNWPGMSTLLIQGVSRRDYPMVQGVVLVIASLFLLLNLLVDVVNAYVDPRIRYS
jgi:peptide/nickel transport system permease protein